MSFRSALYITATLAAASVVLVPLSAQAGGMSRVGTYGGKAGSVAIASGGPNCKQGGGSPGYRPSTIENNINVYKPTTVTTDINVYKPISINNNITVYKPVTVSKNVDITNNIDNSKNISIYKPVSITKNIDDSKNIDINKNININKSVVINSGSSEADAVAIAQAVAEAAASAGASANAAVNISGSFNGANSSNSSSTSNSAAFSNSASFNNNGSFSNGGGFIPEAPGMTVGDIGNITVEIAQVTAAPQPCVYEEATIIKAIHATCVSTDGHEFPASHMVADTWINSGYEGEVARCLPGSRLKIVVGQVVQSSEGMASSYSSGQVLQCGPHEALRHYKDGLLKCAEAVAVPDCTERTNLRKYGLGDMFFTYRAKVCLQTHQEVSQVDISRESRIEQPSY